MWESATNLPDAARLAVMADFLNAPELSSFVPAGQRAFADRTEPIPVDYLKETPFYTTKLMPGSPDRFVIDEENVRYADTPPGFAFERYDVACISVSTQTMMPWRFPADAAYFHLVRPPQAGNHVIVQLWAAPPPGQPTQGQRYRAWAAANAPHLLKKLVAFDENEIKVKQYNPEKEEVLSISDIYSVMRVIEREELYGPFLQIYRK
jgi:hypothetical protein